MKKRNKLVFVLILLALLFFFVPIPGSRTIYPPPRDIACGGISCTIILWVSGSLSYWLTGYGGVIDKTNTFPYSNSYWIALG